MFRKNLSAVTIGLDVVITFFQVTFAMFDNFKHKKHTTLKIIRNKTCCNKAKQVEQKYDSVILI